MIYKFYLKTNKIKILTWIKIRLIKYIIQNYSLEYF